jgi:glutaconate CoA-transferase subunit B
MSSPRPDPLLLIAALAGWLDGCRHVAVGAASPVPGAAALLARARSGGTLRVTVLGSRRLSPFTDGGRELFDCAGQGRIDAMFFGGGEIDGSGNVNLVGVGGYPRSEVRFPGSFGTPFLAFSVPRIILFREEHSPRVLVPRVSFVSAPGTSPEGVWRRGGPVALVTGRCVFAFERERARFRLVSLHPGETLAGVRAATGFDFDAAADPIETPGPSAEDRALLPGVLAAIAETYPVFAASLAGAR